MSKDNNIHKIISIAEKLITEVNTINDNLTRQKKINNILSKRQKEG